MILLQLNEYSEEPLDSCDTGLIEEDGSDAQTVGDHLCKRAYDLAVVDKTKDFWYVALVEIGAYVSYCGSKWQGRHMKFDERDRK